MSSVRELLQLNQEELEKLEKTIRNRLSELSDKCVNCTKADYRYCDCRCDEDEELYLEKEYRHLKIAFGSKLLGRLLNEIKNEKEKIEISNDEAWTIIYLLNFIKNANFDEE